MRRRDEMNFDTMEEAFEWMEREVDDPCVDNARFAYEDDATAMAVYESQKWNGCCGSFDEEIVVGGRKAYIGCNYGH
jgi:hypothetical protein